MCPTSGVDIARSGEEVASMFTFRLHRNCVCVHNHVPILSGEAKPMSLQPSPPCRFTLVNVSKSVMLGRALIVDQTVIAEVAL